MKITGYQYMVRNARNEVLASDVYEVPAHESARRAQHDAYHMARDTAEYYREMLHGAHIDVHAVYTLGENAPR